MNGLFESAGSSVPAQYAATWFAQSTILLAVGLLAGRALRGVGPAVQSAIYRTTLCAVLVCPAASLAFSWAGVPGLLLPLPGRLAAEAPIREASRPVITTSVAAPPQDAVREPSPATPPMRAEPAPAMSMAPVDFPGRSVAPSENQRISAANTPPRTDIRQFPWNALVRHGVHGGLLVWFLGSLVLGIRLAIGQRGLARLRSAALPAEPQARQLCDALAGGMRLRSPEVLRSPFLPSPCLEGIRRPAILLPDDADEALRETFVHELAHLARHDAFWNLLRLGSTAVFWPQPLLWMLSRRLESTAEEVCDDHVVQFGADRAQYAGHLLELAERRLLPLIPAGVGMVSLRSLLARRVIRILDSSRVLSTEASGRALTVTVLFGLASTLLAGLLGVGRAAPTQAADNGKAQAASKSTTAPNAESKRRTIHGKLLTPDGQPAVGALVTVARFRAGALDNPGWDTDREELDRAVTGSDGQFSLTYPSLDLTSSEDPESPEHWDQVIVVASTPGAGPAWAAAMQTAEDHPLQLALAQDDVPVNGRVVDLEGRPVAGATVRIESLWGAKSSEAITAWQHEVKRDAQKNERPTSHYFPIDGKLPKSEPVIATPVMTDSEGRFQLRGLGRDRLAVIDVRGPSVAVRRVQVVTRAMERLEGRHLDEPGLNDPTYYGASPTIVVEPGRAVEGVVRDADTKTPIANALVTVSHLAGVPTEVSGIINAVSDAEGRYRLIGLHKADGHRVGVQPPLDQPYFITDGLAVPAGPGLGPVTLNIELRRGMWITGRVTDAKTGEPVQAAIHYFPFLKNEHAQDFSNFEAGSISVNWTGSRYRTDRDGHFRIVALPGKGLLAARAFDRSYRIGVGADQIDEKPAAWPGRPTALPTFNRADPNDYHAVALVDPADDAAELVRDLKVEQAPGVVLDLVDPEGNPVSGAAVYGRFPGRVDYGDHGLYDRSRVEIVGLDPTKARRVVIQHQGRKLGVVLVLRPGEVGNRRVTLRPYASVTGKVVDIDGKPVRGGVVAELPSDESTQSFAMEIDSAAFDEEGRFRIDSLPVGGAYILQAVDRLGPSSDSPQQFATFALAHDLRMEPGQAVDLGTFSSATGQRVEEPKPKARDEKADPNAASRVTVQGRIVDLEGRPVAGVHVQVNPHHGTPPGGNLTAWLDAVRGGAPPWVAAEQFEYVPGRPDEKPLETVTDADGRFRAEGLVRERILNVKLEGLTIATNSITVVTRPLEPFPASGFPSSYGSGTETIYGLEFTHTARPGRMVEGVVRDAKTGAALEGVSVESYRFAGSSFIGTRNIKTITDKGGKFRVVGMPKGPGNILIAIPNDDQPYFMREFDVPDPAGIEPVHAEIDLHRGIWIEGKVIEKATGAPVANARLHYLPFLSNAFAQAIPEFDPDRTTDGTAVQDRYNTKEDGSFRLVGLPGRAIVGVVVHQRPCLVGYGSANIAGMNASGNFETWFNPITPGKHWPTSMKEINPSEGQGSFRVDLELVTGASVRVRVVDAGGKPVSGATVAGREGWGTREADPQPDAEFAVSNLAPDETRTIMIRHRGQQLGKVIRVTPGDDKDGAVLVTLAPLATIAGRVVDKDGVPVANATVRTDLQPTVDFNLNLGHVSCGRDGRFQIPNVPVGCDYALAVESGASVQDRRFAFLTGVKVRPGETNAVGDVSFKNE